MHRGRVEARRERRQADVAVPVQKEDKHAKKDYGKGVEIVNMVKDKALTSYESANEKLKKVMRLSGREIPQRPSCPDPMRGGVSKCLFVECTRGELAGDGGQHVRPVRRREYRVSRPPRARCRRRAASGTGFPDPSRKVELDDDDKVEIVVYDRTGGLNDFIGYAKVDMEGVRVDEGAGHAVRQQTQKDSPVAGLEPLPKNKADFFDMNHMKGSCSGGRARNHRPGFRRDVGG